MVGSLGPAVSGANRPRSFGTSTAYGLGLVIGSLLTALSLSVLGRGLEVAGLKFVATFLVGAALLVAVAQVAGAPVLQSRWQVPEHWRRYLDLDVLAGFYGFLLGIGFVTAVGVSAFWVFAALSLTVSPVVVLGAWLTYAGVRGVGFWVLSRRRSSDQSHSMARWRRPLAVVATGMSLVGATSFFLPTF